MPPPNSNDKLLTTPKRNNYFYGKMLDKNALEKEQYYVNQKRWLLNRFILGSGVVGGLAVEPADDGAEGAVFIQPGLALSQGREIIVPEAVRVDNPRQPTDAEGNPVGDPLEEGTVNICLAYAETKSEPVPILAPECAPGEECAKSTVCEGFTVLVQRPEEAPAVEPACNFSAELFTSSGDGDGFPNIQGELAGRISEACPEPEDDPCIVLAQIELPEGGEAITEGMIDLDVRPVVYNNDLLFELLLCLAEQGGGEASGEGTEPALTKIDSISWPHNDELTLGDFTEGLTVSFDGPITPTTEKGQAWFVVTVEYPIVEDLHPPMAGRGGTILVQRVLGAVAINEAGNEVTFEPHDGFEETFRRTLAAAPQNAELPLCRVVLKCDFLHDGENAADGNHLGGTLPSGNGVPGGEFESWFTLTTES